MPRASGRPVGRTAAPARIAATMAHHNAGKPSAPAMLPRLETAATQSRNCNQPGPPAASSQPRHSCGTSRPPHGFLPHLGCGCPVCLHAARTNIKVSAGQDGHQTCGGCPRSNATTSSPVRGVPCRRRTPFFSRRTKKGTELHLSLPAQPPELPFMTISALAHAGFNTAWLSCLSARKGGLFPAIKAGVPEAFFCRPAPDVAARHYVNWHSPALVFRTYESFAP
jgi:hypothetical protein